MMNVVGYVKIKPNAINIQSHLGLDSFQNKICRVVEFASDGDALVLNNEATALGMVKKEDISHQFKCSIYGDILCPPDMTIDQQLIYSAKCLSRKGGYNHVIKGMVIMNSLRIGEFNDKFLWA